MSNFSIKEIEMFSNKILEDYDNKIPGLIFKEKKKLLMKMLDLFNQMLLN